ncbi:MAG: F0F1 ATP synthase subunit A [Pseudomonadota bacterium]
MIASLFRSLLPSLPSLPDLGGVLQASGGFSWYHLLPGVADDSLIPGMLQRNETWAIPAAWAACGVIILLAWFARRGLDRARARGGVEALVPDSTLTPRNALEIVVEALYELAESTLGPKDAKIFFPFLGSIFVYVLISNLMGLIPGFLPHTSCVSSNLALAVVVFLTFNGVGLVRNGFGYIKHLGGPIIYLAWFFFPIETVGLFVRPLSLTLRLAGNMFGDHTVFGIMSDLVPPLLPAILLALGMFVSFIQALVFMLLTTVYISLAAAHDEGH